MRYGVLIQDFTGEISDKYGGSQNIGQVSGYAFKAENGYLDMSGYSYFDLGVTGVIPIDIAAEITKFEYNRLKALQEPEYTELTIQQIEDKLGHKVKIIKGEE